MYRTITIIVLIIVLAGALVLAQAFYFSPKEAAVARGARISFESKAGEDKAAVLEKITNDLLENEQFKNLGKNGDWPLTMEKLVKDKVLPFIKADK